MRFGNLSLNRLQKRLARAMGAEGIWHGYRSPKATRHHSIRKQPRAAKPAALRHGVTLPAQFRAPVTATKFVAYIRISEGRASLTSMGEQDQRRVIQRFLRDKGPIIAEYVEYESAYGKRCRRPKLLAAIELCRRENAALIVARVNRLARNVAFTASLMESDIEFHTLDVPSANKLTIHILAAFAEYDSRKKSERLRLAKAVFKAQGRRITGFAQWPPERRLRHQKLLSARSKDFYLRFAQAVHPVIDRLRAQGFRTYREIAAGLALEGVPTRYHKKWNLTNTCVVDVRGRDVLQSSVPELVIPAIVRARYYAAQIRRIEGTRWMSYTQIAQELNARKIWGPKNGLWNGVTVSRALARSKLKAIEYVNGKHRSTYVLPPIGQQ